MKIHGLLPPRTLLACALLAIAFDGVSAQEHPLQRMLNQHCIDCHSNEHHEGGVQLDEFAAVSPASRAALLNRIEEQLLLGNMPPIESDQPSSAERAEFLNIISQAFAEIDAVSTTRDRLESPRYANYLDHDRLFHDDVTEAPYSPARLWRTSPFLYDNLKNDLGGNPKLLRQPFIVDDKEGIRDYAALLFADSAVVNVLLTNAGTTADHLMEKDRLFHDLIQADTDIESAAFQSAIQTLFERVVGRPPTDPETSRYQSLFARSETEAGAAEALRLTLIAVMLHHEAVYRTEIGLGESLPDGRRMLASAELAFAIAGALTDKRPDPELLEAVRTGRLVTREDAREQVMRLLSKGHAEKPRILRFFREFFGYDQAHKVFKDAKRSGGFSYYGENYPEMYERDADFFVMHILEDDRDVFRRLLTSDEYFILNRQTFRNTIYAFYQEHRDQLEEGELTEPLEKELLQRLDLNDWSEVNVKYHLHNFNRGFRGNARAVRQIVKEVRQWKNTDDEEQLLHGMQPLYKRYPMVYDLEDNEQDFLQPQPYRRPHRAGMLTHPAWLIAHSLNDTTDPIRRGKWIRERLLAGTVPDLPITVDATIPEDHSKTLRERLSVTEQEECWRCHQKMNPLGYPFEIYDDFGRYRTEEVLDKLPKENGRFPAKPVNPATSLEDTGDPTIDGPANDALHLIEKLADSNRVRQSMIRHAFRYFLGRNELLSDAQTLREADRAYLESGGSFHALLTSLLTSDSFLYRR